MNADESPLRAGPLLRTRGLGKEYGQGEGLVRALDAVDLELAPGETLAVMGPSGCGKSTLLHLLGGLERPSAGEVWLEGRRIDALSEKALARLRRQAIGFVFQAFHLVDELTAAENVELPALLAGRSPRAARRRAAELLGRVGLTDRAEHLPSELSGGQRQRVAIARALALEPRLVICDEAVSALDLSTQSAIINLLADLQQSSGMSYLFIAHDLGVTRHLSDRIAVLLGGRLVEIARTQRLFDAPRHPYTRALIAASPASHPEGRERRRARRLAHRPNRTGDVIPRGTVGCPFRNRCDSVMDVCHTVTPVLRALDAETKVACHLYEDGAA
jgi:peptide/nickel transport system ATP-binding protein